MTIEDALGRILNERGYLVYATNEKHVVGDIVYGYADGQPIKQPCYVIDESSFSEWISWTRRIDELLERGQQGNATRLYYYRVATD